MGLSDRGYELEILRSSTPEVFLGKGVLRICSKFTGEHPFGKGILINKVATLLKSHFGMGVLQFTYFQNTFS